MQFHLNFKPEVSSEKISHQNDILMLGSCFTEHIGNKLKDLKFNVNSNPFGIIFNPLSIADLINRAIHKIYFTPIDVFEKNKLWFCYQAHTSIFYQTEKDVLHNLNHLIDNLHEKLKTINWLCITFGSAYYYNLLSNQQTVANCHKLPAQLFKKNLADTFEISNLYNSLSDDLITLNPNLKVIYTVSPVKHLRDGVVENSLSKAILLQATHQIITKNKNCVYFPAYELVNDDLRDYRFYEKDLAHPNQLAIDYVWEKFSETFFNDNTKTLNTEIAQLNLAIKHKPFNALTTEHQVFKANFYKKCTEMALTFPYLNFKEELNYFSS